MKPLAALSAAALCLSLAACGDDGGGDGVQVVASFYPAQFLAERIGGDDVSVSTLTTPGAEPHDLELTAKQVVEVNEADVLVYLDGFQDAVDVAVADADRDLARTVDLGEWAGEVYTDDEGHEDHGHDHGDDDPHVWLNPTNMVNAAEAVRDALAIADPDHEDAYDANAEALIDELEELDTDFSAGLDTCERKVFVTSHAAFGHLADAYDLVQEPISGVDPQSEPSTAALASITDLVKSDGITTIFTERLASPALAETVARETGARTAVLDPIEGLSDETEDEDYVSLMRQNLAALQEANGCA